MTARDVMVESPVTRILQKLPGAKRIGTNWLARCPVHDDRTPSLSISEGEDGRALLHCHAGCPPEAILAALGLSMSDLFPAPPAVRSPNPRTSRPSETAYVYRNAEGVAVGRVVRYADKRFRQDRPDGQGGWIPGLMGRKLPLFQEDRIAAAPVGSTVYVTEGEKDAGRLSSLGLLSTTNAGGAGKWRDSYSHALADMRVAVLADNDPPGREHARQVATSLVRHAAEIKVVELPGLPETGDVSDWLDQGHTLEDLLAAVEAAPRFSAGNLEPEAQTDTGSGTCRPRFPIDVLPPVPRDLAIEAAAALGIPIDYLATAILAIAAGVLGNSVQIEVKGGWREKPIVWMINVGRPGSGKSPALEIALGLVRPMQTRAFEQFQEEVVRFREAAGSQGKRAASANPPVAVPSLEHHFTTNATMEAALALLQSSPGITIVQDEALAWLLSFDAYRRAGDRQTYMQLWSGATVKVDRKTSPPLYVPDPCVSFIGGLQPALLSQLRGEMRHDDGFIDRILHSWPDCPVLRWSDQTIDSRVLQAAVEWMERLRRPAGQPAVTVRLSPDAKQRYQQWFDENAGIADAATSMAAGFATKLSRHVARLSLLLHCLWNPKPSATTVSLTTMDHAIVLGEYFRQHHDLVLEAIGARASGRSAGTTSRVLRLLQRKGGNWISRSELIDGLRSVSAVTLEEALAQLQGEGRVTCRTVATATKSRQEWRAVAATESPDSDYSENLQAPSPAVSGESASADRRANLPKNPNQVFSLASGAPRFGTAFGSPVAGPPGGTLPALPAQSTTTEVDDDFPF